MIFKKSKAFKVLLRLAGTILYLLHELKQGIIYLRSGRKPVLIVRLPRHSTYHDQVASQQSIGNDPKLQRDYHTLVTIGTANNEIDAVIYSTKDMKPGTVEAIRKELFVKLIEQQATKVNQRRDFEKFTHRKKR